MRSAVTSSRYGKNTSKMSKWIVTTDSATVCTPNFTQLYFRIIPNAYLQPFMSCLDRQSAVDPRPMLRIPYKVRGAKNALDRFQCGIVTRPLAAVLYEYDMFVN